MYKSVEIPLISIRVDKAIPNNGHNICITFKIAQAMYYKPLFIQKLKNNTHLVSKKNYKVTRQNQ
jgi:hypothetical protein